MRYDESEYVFCDLQAIYRYIRQDDEAVARRFLEAAYDSFEFLAENPKIGRARPEFAHAGLRSWRVQGFRSYLIFYAPCGERLQIWRVLHGSRDLQAVMK
ncbi:type II toxin-antitoxin system RelE/ParE family toxin [Prosthecobacter sp.]|uniref:type II toxin-antitoxin system RelE/ParE family toxin n=1 Tax=Prosthecobacter sp. TaxID=1965333 RepID=UPI003784D71B